MIAEYMKIMEIKKVLEQVLTPFYIQIQVNLLVFHKH